MGSVTPPVLAFDNYRLDTVCLEILEGQGMSQSAESPNFESEARGAENDGGNNGQCGFAFGKPKPNSRSRFVLKSIRI